MATEQKKQTLLQTIGGALKDLDAATAGVETAKAALGFVRVRLGGLFSDYLADLAKKDVTGEAAQKKILDLIGDRTDENGKQYAWTTVDAWITRAAVERSLPEDLHGVFNSDGLRTIARVEKKAGKDESGQDLMVSFAKDLKKDGKTSVRQVRAAFAEKYPAKPPGERSSASLAEDLRKAFADGARVHVNRMVRENLDRSYVMPYVIFGIALGQAQPKDVEACTMAASMLLDTTEAKKKAAARAAKAKQKAAA